MKITSPTSKIEFLDSKHLDNGVTNGYGHFRIAKNPDVIRSIVAFIAD